MKKIIEILIVTLLIGTTFLPLASSIDEDKNIEILSNLPDYFNWMDQDEQDWTTPAKDQAFPHFCGSYWVFSALGIVESVINIREGIADLDVDLSEQYVLSCLYGGSCEQGSDSSAIRAIIDNSSRGNNYNGIIPEQCFPYQARDDLSCDDKSEDWDDYLIPLLDWGIKITDKNSIEDRDMVKSLIMQYGPISTGMLYNLDFSFWEWTHHSPDDYFPYENVTFTNHVVNVVGWKDDETIEQGGYWICKNSYGIDTGYNGFFNIEYGSLGICEFYVLWVDYDPESYDWHPVPKINVPNQDSYYGIYGLINEPLQFNGDAAGEHPPFTYHWDFGDDATSEEQNPSHTYTDSGEYKLKLTVTDDNGVSFYDLKTVYIQEANQPPDLPILQGFPIAKAGEYAWHSITLSDPDGSILYIYEEYFGDESGTWWGPYLSGETIYIRSLNRTETGVYDIKVKAKDPYGVESNWATLKVFVPKSKSNSIFNPWISSLIKHFPVLELIL